MTNVTLAIRMILYFLSAAAASQGLAVYDEAAGTLTFEVESLAIVIGGALTFGGTFAVSRFAKLR